MSSNDRYASEALSDLIDAPNIYPVGGGDREFSLRSPTETPVMRRNPPSSPVNRFNFDDYYNESGDESEGPIYDDTDYLGEDTSEDFAPTSPIRREFSAQTETVPPVSIRGASSLDSFTDSSVVSPRVSSGPSPPAIYPVSSRTIPRISSRSRVGSGTSSRIASPPTPPAPTISSVSASRKATSESTRRTPVSYASRTSPRSILFPPDTKVSSEKIKTSSNVEDLLISNGYAPVKTIIVDNAIGKSDFILAVNKRGQYVLVSLNGKGKGLEGEIVHTEIIKNNSNIPYSSKRGAFECANGVCGVAYDSEKELNIVTRDEFSMEPHSETLVYKGENVASIGNNIPIPVVSYNDIVHDPIGVLKNSYEITDRLHRHEYENCKAGMVEASTEFKDLESALKSYMLLEITLAKELAISMGQLRSFAAQYERDPPEDEKERENYDLVRFNLRKRSDLFITLINCCGKISGMKNTFAELTKTIHELHELCEREFSGVSRVMSP